VTQLGHDGGGWLLLPPSPPPENEGLGGGNSNIFCIFIPKIGEDNPI